LHEKTHIDLFSGIGGFTLAAQWAGFKTIVFCEKEKYCQKVLKQHWAEVPIIPDIRDFDGTEWRGATLLTGGFPCQPFSVAGQRKGQEDDRFLWPEMLRVIKEAQPSWVIAENVTGIVRMALEQVLSDLESIGYDFPRDVNGCPVVPVIPASAVNAPHQRKRVWIIAHSRCEYGEGQPHQGEVRGQTGQGDAPQPERPTEDGGTRNISNDWHAKGAGQSGRLMGSGERQYGGTGSWGPPWLEVATRFCRVDDGLPPWVYSNRVKRLKALGNAIVPQIAYEIIKGIREIENTKEGKEG